MIPIWLVLIMSVFAARALAVQVADRPGCAPLRRWLTRRYPHRDRPLFDPNGSPALIHNDETGGVEAAVEWSPHWLPGTVGDVRAMCWWTAGLVVLAAHGVGLLDSWALVPLAWLGVAGAAAVLPN